MYVCMRMCDSSANTAVQYQLISKSIKTKIWLRSQPPPALRLNDPAVHPISGVDDVISNNNNEKIFVCFTNAWSHKHRKGMSKFASHLKHSATNTYKRTYTFTCKNFNRHRWSQRASRTCLFYPKAAALFLFLLF